MHIPWFIKELKILKGNCQFLQNSFVIILSHPRKIHTTFVRIRNLKALTNMLNFSFEALAE